MTKLAKKNTRGYLVCLVKLTAQKSQTPSFSPSLKKGTTMTKDCNYDKATGKTAIGLSLGVIFKTNPKRTHRGWRSWGTKSHLHHWNNSRRSFWVMWATGRLIFLQQHLITEVHPKAPNTSCTPHLRSIPAHPPTTSWYSGRFHVAAGCPRRTRDKRGCHEFSFRQRVDGSTIFRKGDISGKTYPQMKTSISFYESSLTDLITGGNSL